MKNIKLGSVVEGRITGITRYGIFVRLEDNYVGLIHISEVSDKFISDLEKKYNIGDIIKVKVLAIDENKLQVKLSIKKIESQFKNEKVIEEKGEGFKPLQDNLTIWIEETLKKNEKS